MERWVTEGNMLGEKLKRETIRRRREDRKTTGQEEENMDYDQALFTLKKKSNIETVSQLKG